MTLSPDQSRKKRTSACIGCQSEDHVGHTHTGSTRHDPDNNDRHESPTNPGDVDREVTQAAMLMEGNTVQSLLNVQKNTPVWAALAHNVLDFPDTSVGSSRRQLGRNTGMDATESAVQMTMGVSGKVFLANFWVFWALFPLSMNPLEPSGAPERSSRAEHCGVSRENLMKVLLVALHSRHFQEFLGDLCDHFIVTKRGVSNQECCQECCRKHAL